MWIYYVCVIMYLFLMILGIFRMIIYLFLMILGTFRMIFNDSFMFLGVVCRFLIFLNGFIFFIYAQNQ